MSCLGQTSCYLLGREVRLKEPLREEVGELAGLEQGSQAGCGDENGGMI